MVRRARFENFAVLPNAEWHLGAHVNVLVGDNGTGERQLLEAVYALLKVTAEPKAQLSKAYLERAYADKLRGVFLPDRLGRLVKRSRGRRSCSVALDLAEERRSLELGFSTQAKTAVRVARAPSELLDADLVFFPTRELNTMAPWLPQHYGQYAIPMEETDEGAVAAYTCACDCSV